MAKVKISQWDVVAANNTDINSININEGCPPSTINNAIREMMSQVKDLQGGYSGDTIPVAAGGTGATTASTARTNLGITGIATQDPASVNFTGGNITGLTNLSTGIFTATGTTTLSGTNTLSGPTTLSGASTASSTLTSSGTLAVTGGLTLDGAAGTSGQVLVSSGAGNTPTWANDKGTILQVVNKVISTQGSQTITGSDTQVGSGTDFDLSITPKGNGSKFIVSARWFGEVDVTWDVSFNIQRNGVRINTINNSNKHGLSMATSTLQGNNDSTPEIMYLQTVDSTGSTIGTAITYTLIAVSSSGNHTMWTNRCFGSSHETGISELMIMEVAA